jgi:putative NADH-flavin reductase
VRALARSAGRIPVSDPNLEKITGDALDFGTMTQALAGINVAIQALGVDFGPDTIFRGTQLFSLATRILVKAMEESSVRRLISVTGLGAGNSRDRGGFLYDIAFHLFLERVYSDKDEQEWIIRNSTLEWVIVRPAVLTNGPRTGNYRVLVHPREWRSGFISRADVADFLVKQINDDTFLGQTPVLTG